MRNRPLRQAKKALRDLIRRRINLPSRLRAYAFLMNLPHLPALRRGKPYASLDQNDIVAHATGEKIATISQVNAGIIRKDLAKISEARAALKNFTVAELIEISAKAGEHFLNGELPFGDKGHTQTADDYVRTLSSTSGLPHVMVRRNMAKIHHALTNMRTVLNGLTRGLPLEVIDRGYGEQSGAAVSYFPTTQALGLVMPSNSPAVNSLWLPAIALKTPVIIKPGREEPWTPYRLIQAFIAAGAPRRRSAFIPPITKAQAR
jgi:acyl-CoA reductase-like NAD-dependent aldehyde dehydrogenase